MYEGLLVILMHRCYFSLPHSHIHNGVSGHPGLWLPWLHDPVVTMVPLLITIGKGKCDVVSCAICILCSDID